MARGKKVRTPKVAKHGSTQAERAKYIKFLAEKRKLIKKYWK